MPDRLFVAACPTGLVFADRGREEHGDYAKLAHYSAAEDKITFYPGSAPFQDRIEHVVNATRAKGRIVISACGHSIPIG